MGLPRSHDMTVWQALIISFVSTLVIEGIIASVFFRGVSLRRRVVTVAAINLITNPLLNIMLQLLAQTTGSLLIYEMAFVIGEGVVFGVEACLLMRCCRLDKEKALLWSVALNVPTALLGQFLLILQILN